MRRGGGGSVRGLLTAVGAGDEAGCGGGGRHCRRGTRIDWSIPKGHGEEYI